MKNYATIELIHKSDMHILISINGSIKEFEKEDYKFAEKLWDLCQQNNYIINNLDFSFSSYPNYLNNL